MNTKFLVTIFIITGTLFSFADAAPAPEAPEVLGVIGSPPIQSNWTESSFLQCVKQLNGFKSANVVDDNVAFRCRGVYRNGDVNLHTPSGKNSDRCPASFLPPTSEEVDKKSCAKKLSKNFEEAAPFRAAVDAVCHDLVGSLMEKGMNHITHQFTDASSKPSLWLLKNKKVILETTMNLTPQTRAALKAGKIAKATLNTLCENGLKDFGTKGKGCTHEVNYYKKTLGISHHGIPYDAATTTAVKDGLIDLFVDNALESIGTIALSWSKPK
ncbi:hypothetical protein ABOM_003214 [Aspergillus bombycis]|uniref:Secreted protein n=1 Tax=Aspergillus bombycis TaxID=109264 RepID=A0A1F8AB56_9EURO|nr:hypothetical protein ABOM_003214 [Aspergillus bombycis]OGM48891.1 hypothetical protein ABOM_003214 [Aspergillus bombycis]